MERSNLRLLFPHTNIYMSIKSLPYRKTITYQKERILVYLFDLKTNELINMYILKFNFNLTNTKCKIELYIDGKYKDYEMLYINKNQMNDYDIKTKVKKR